MRFVFLISSSDPQAIKFYAVRLQKTPFSVRHLKEVDSNFLISLPPDSEIYIEEHPQIESFVSRFSSGKGWQLYSFPPLEIESFIDPSLFQEIRESIPFGTDVVSMARDAIDRKWHSKLQKMGYTEEEIDWILDEAVKHNKRVSLPRPINI
jgi:hypothetical protein